MTDLVLGLALFGTALFALGALLGSYAYSRYVGSLGWEKAGVHIHDENCGVFE